MSPAFTLMGRPGTNLSSARSRARPGRGLCFSRPARQPKRIQNDGCDRDSQKQAAKVRRRGDTKADSGANSDIRGQARRTFWQEHQNHRRQRPPGKSQRPPHTRRRSRNSLRRNARRHSLAGVTQNRFATGAHHLPSCPQQEAGPWLSEVDETVSCG
jgi:hypothetical protein